MTTDTLPVVVSRADALPCTCGHGDAKDKHHEGDCPRWRQYVLELNDKVSRTVPGLAPLPLPGGNAELLIYRCNEDTDLDQLAAASDAVDAMYERVKELRAMRDDIFRRRIETHGRFTLGGKLWRLVDRKPVKVKSKVAALRAVLDACDGDEEKVAQAMSSEPFKHGYCRSLLGDKWGEVFEEVPTKVLDKVDEPGPRQLQGIPVGMLK